MSAQRPVSARAKDSATYSAYLTGWSLVRKLPERTAYSMFDRIADRVWRQNGKGVQTMERNYARAVPGATSEELRELSREGMRRYFRYWCDAFRLPDWDRQRIVQSFAAINSDILGDAVTSGRGCIVALPHMGNWDHAGAWGVMTHVPEFTVVAERLEPEKLFQKFVDFREGIGMEILPLTGGPSIMPALAERLEAGGTIALVSDRDLTRNGLRVKFLGEETKMPAGPAALAVKTGALLVPLTLWYDGPLSYGHFHQPIPVPDSPDPVHDMTQSLADVFSDSIREHPVDWHMMQSFFLSDLDPARLAASEAGPDPEES